MSCPDPDFPRTGTMICFQPHTCETLPDQPDHSCPISPVSLKKFFIAYKVEMPKSKKKSQENIVFGNLEQAMPEGFRNLSRFARSGFGGRSEADRCRSAPPDHRSRCGLEGRSPLPDHTSRSPRRSGQANDAPIRGQLSSR